MPAGSGHRCDRVTAIERLLGREDVVAHLHDIDGTFAQFFHLVFGGREILVGEYSEHAGMRFGGTRVDRDDSCVGVRAAQDASVDHPREADVGAVLRLASDLLHAVWPDRAGANYFVFGLFNGTHITSPLACALR